MRKTKNAFTMAEVLITLGIIGIIAALTIPQLIKNYEKKALHTQFLKAYSDLSNAAKMFEVQEGFTVHEYSKIINPDGGNPSHALLTLFMKYFNCKSKISGLTQNGYENTIGYLPAALNGSKPISQPCDESDVATDISGRFFVMDNLLNGTFSNVRVGPKICVDTNGKKGPNKYGYDWFVFAFTEKKGVIPYIGDDLTGYGEDLQDPSTMCSYTQNTATYTCAYYALSDTSPDGNGSYWKDFLR